MKISLFTALAIFFGLFCLLECGNAFVASNQRQSYRWRLKAQDTIDICVSNTRHHLQAADEETSGIKIQETLVGVIKFASSLLLFTTFTLFFSLDAFPAANPSTDAAYYGGIMPDPAIATAASPSSTADAQCFMNQCRSETQRAFSNPRNIQGLACWL